MNKKWKIYLTTRTLIDIFVYIVGIVICKDIKWLTLILFYFIFISLLFLVVLLGEKLLN